MGCSKTSGGNPSRALMLRPPHLLHFVFASAESDVGPTISLCDCVSLLHSLPGEADSASNARAGISRHSFTLFFSFFGVSAVERSIDQRHASAPPLCPVSGIAPATTLEIERTPPSRTHARSCEDRRFGPVFSSVDGRLAGGQTHERWRSPRTTPQPETSFAKAQDPAAITPRAPDEIATKRGRGMKNRRQEADEKCPP